MPLAAEGVFAAKTMIDVRNTVFEERSEVALVNPLKVFLRYRLTIAWYMTHLLAD